MKFLLLFISLLLHPAFAQDGEEALIQDIGQDRHKQMNRAVEADKVRAQVEANLASSLENIQTDITKMDDKAVEKLQALMRDSKMSDQDPEMIRGHIRGQFQGKPMQKVIERFPVILEIMVDVVRDKEALSALIGIFLRKDDLKKYGFIALFIFILGFLIRKYVFNPDWGFFTRFFMRMGLSLTLTASSLFIFYSMFKSEVGPVVRIISNHF